MRTLLFAAALLASVPASAQEREYRTLRLNDGRTLTAAVVASTADGMELELPQGLTKIGYAQLVDLGIISAPDYERQGPVTIAIAPAGAVEGLEGIAAELDGWLDRAVGLVPATTVLRATAWQQQIGGGSSLAQCAGAPECLAGLAATAGADFVLIPSLTDVARPLLKLQGVVASTGAALGDGQAGLVVRSGGGERGLDASASSTSVAQAVFAGLDLRPAIDLQAAATAAFPPPPPVVAEAEPAPEPPAEPTVAEAEPAPEPEPAAEPEPAPEPAVAEAEPEPALEPEPVPEPAVAEAEPEPAPEPAVAEAESAPEPMPTRGKARPTLGRAMALGALPVPGISSAYLKDPAGFLASVASSVGAGWVTVWGVGRTARTVEGFWAPAVLAPYGINTAINEVAAAAGYQRLYKDVPTVQTRQTLRPGTAIVPLLDERGRTTGAAVVFTLR